MQNNKTIVALIISISLLTFNGFGQDKIVDQIIAVIGSNVILKSDIESLNLQKQAQGITTEGDMKCEILEDLLIEKLLVAEAELDTNIVVTDNQINQQLDMRVSYFLQHLGNEKAVEEYFKKPIAQLKADLTDVIRNEILSGQMRSTIIENVKATPSQVRYYYKNLSNDEKPQVKTQYKYAQITAMPVIDEKEENGIKDELRKIKKRVEAGENFAMFAVLYSEGPSAATGGELGYFGKATMDPAFSTAAFNLKPGQVSNVVKSEFGYHIIQMIDRKGDKVNCRHIIMKPKIKIETKEKLIERLDSLADAIRKDDIKFEDAAMRYSADKNSRNNGGIVVDPMSMSASFEAEMLAPAVSKILTKLKINEVSDPFISINDKQRETIMIVKLLSKTEAHTASISEDYPLISNMYLQYKQNEVIQEWIGKRQSKTYIRIDDSYLNCDFKFKNWIK